jgi:hypothetical protein
MESTAEGVSSVWKNTIKDGLIEFFSFMNKEGGTLLNVIADPLVKKLIETGMISERFVEDITEKLGDATLSAVLFKLAFVLLGFPHLLSSYFLAFFKLQEQENNKRYRPELPDLGTAVKGYYKDEISLDWINDLYARHGIKDQDWRFMLQANETELNPTEIFPLFWRELISEEHFKKHLFRLGYNEDSQNKLFELAKNLPPIQDVIRFAVRDAFNENVVREFQLLEDYPELLTQYAKWQGYSEDIAKLYWAAHWYLPSALQGFEMLHRDVIDQDQLELLLKTADYPAFWREKLIAISYRVLSRVDVRRMHAVGVLTPPQVKRKYMDMGYSEDDAQLMTDFTVRYNAPKEFQLSKSQILTAYKDQIVSKDEAIQMLEDINISREGAELLLLFEDYKEQRKLVTEEIKLIEKYFINGEYSEGEAGARLRGIGVKENKIDLLFEKWQLRKEETRKSPSMENLVNWFKIGALTEQEYRDELRAKNWPEKYIEKFIMEAQAGSG